MTFRTIILTGSIFLSLQAAARGNAQEAVAAAAERLRQAMISGDSTALAAIALPELSYGHSGGHVDDYHEFVGKIASGKSDFVSIDISDQNISLHRDVAVLRHHLKAETADKGVPGHVDLQVMMVWVKSRGDWKLLARQAVKAGK